MVEKANSGANDTIEDLITSFKNVAKEEDNIMGTRLIRRRMTTRMPSTVLKSL
jgi:hypothetical protein